MEQYQFNDFVSGRIYVILSEPEHVTHFFKECEMNDLKWCSRNRASYYNKEFIGNIESGERVRIAYDNFGLSYSVSQKGSFTVSDDIDIAKEEVQLDDLVDFKYLSSCSQASPVSPEDLFEVLFAT